MCQKRTIGPRLGKISHFSRQQVFGKLGHQVQTEIQPMDIDHSSRYKLSKSFHTSTAQHSAPIRSQQYFNRLSMPHQQSFGQAVKRPNDESMKFTNAKYQRNTQENLSAAEVEALGRIGLMRLIFQARLPAPVYRNGVSREGYMIIDRHGSI